MILRREVKTPRFAHMFEHDKVVFAAGRRPLNNIVDPHLQIGHSRLGFFPCVFRSLDLRL